MPWHKNDQYRILMKFKLFYQYDFSAKRLLTLIIVDNNCLNQNNKCIMYVFIVLIINTFAHYTFIILILIDRNALIYN